MRKLAALLIVLGCGAWCVLRYTESRIERSLIDMDLPEEFANLPPLHTKLGSPQSGDWLETHNERGQTFLDYRRMLQVGHIGPDECRRTIYVQPLGDLSPAQRRVVRRAAQLLEISFKLGKHEKA